MVGGEAHPKASTEPLATINEVVDTSAKGHAASKQPKTVADFLDGLRLQSDVIDKDEETKNADGDALISDSGSKVLTAAEEEEEQKTFEKQLDGIDSQLSVREENDVRIAVIGNVDSGKSTLVGCLTKCIKDDGRGSARLKVFNFSHEAQNGRTSSIG